MPEGPEVRLIADEMRDAMMSTYVCEWELCNDKMKFMMNKVEQEIPPGSEIINVSTKGKKIYFIFENPDGDKKYIWNGLGLNGKWSTVENTSCSFSISFSHKYPCDKAEMKTYYYYMGRGSNFDLLTKPQLVAELKKLGPDMMETALGTTRTGRQATCENFISIMRKHNRAAIKNVINNQHYISGIGNYIRCDALNLAKVSPFDKIADISDDRLCTLYKKILWVMKSAYDEGGSINYINEVESLKNDKFKSLLSDSGDLKGKKSKTKQNEVKGYHFVCYQQEYDLSGNPVEVVQESKTRKIYWAPKTQS